MRCFSRLLVALTVTLGTAAVNGQDAPQTPEGNQPHRTQRVQMETQQRSVYGWEMMSPQERNEYQQRMRKAASEQERERIRAEHHERMKERARERGATIFDEPPRKGTGRGMGTGGGMGPGGGTSSGGRGR